MKKLLKMLLPEKIISKIIKLKYKRIFFEIHKENLSKSNIIELKKPNPNLKNIFLSNFGETITINNQKLYFFPIAIIKIPNTIKDYESKIGVKSRNMIKKATKNNFIYKKFQWNEHLDDIFEINTSTSKRQGRDMDTSYKNYPKKVDISDNIYIGIFNDEKLVAYIELYVYEDFGMINRILGHYAYLKFGIMNLALYGLVAECISSENIKYINYLTMANKDNPLSSFKKRVGFEQFSLKVLQC